MKARPPRLETTTTTASDSLFPCWPAYAVAWPSFKAVNLGDNNRSTCPLATYGIDRPIKSVRPLFDNPSAEGFPHDPKSDTRRDGRSLENFRDLYVRTRIVHESSGSCYVEAGNSKVIASVYGPRPHKSAWDFGLATCDFRFASFSGDSRKGISKTAEEREYSEVVCQALVPSLHLEKYPKSSIDIYITVLECDGTISSVGAAISAASVALCEAGIQMDGITVGCSAIRLNGRICVDCSAEEEKMAEGYLLIAGIPKIKKICHIIQVGPWDANDVVETVELLNDGCELIEGLLAKVLIQRLETEMANTKIQ